MNSIQRTDIINKALPQTQCQLCDYPSCRAYAKAIAENTADIDRCHPGGIKTLKKLSEITNKNSEAYQEKVHDQFKKPSIVTIDESLCIGCTKCINACPVAAIIGSNKHMHSIIPSECTGCDLCIPACPMDCIHPEPIQYSTYDSTRLAERFEQKNQRQAQQALKKRDQHQKNKLSGSARVATVNARQAAIQHALKRVQAKREQRIETS